MSTVFNKHKTLFLIVSGAIVGAIFFLLVNTASPLAPTDDSWIMNGYVERDIIQHYTGWLYYRDNHISFPLGVARDIGYPAGGAVAFSDSIPLFSVLFGFLSGILPATFQFFGIYVLLCYMLAGVSGALLLSLFFEKLPPIIIGSVLFTLSPIMVERAFRHTALASHYLIIFALYLYFINRKEAFRFRWGYIFLCFLSVTIHFYFVPMVLAILFADLLSDVINTRKWIPHVGFLILNITTVLLTALTFGYFYSDTTQSGALGFGYFTMNLNALFNPRSTSDIRWSLILPQFGQGLGSAEGFNYLGLAVLLVLATAVFYYIFSNKMHDILRLIKQHLSLVLVSAALTLFAVSTTVVINNNPYLRFPLPLAALRLFSIFRSSGRMFWPVYYILLLFSLYFLKSIINKKIISLILVFFVAIQIADLSPALIEKHRVFTDSDNMFSNPTLDTFFIENRNVFKEIFTFSQDGVDLGMYIANYAVCNCIKTNEPFMARNDIDAYRKAGNDEFVRLMTGNLRDNTLYVFDDVNRFFNAAMFLNDSVISGQLSFSGGYFYIISPRSTKIPEDSAFISFDDISLKIADYTDLTWTDGVLVDNPSIVTFYDNAFTKQFLENAEYLLAGSASIKILNKNYRDEGWVIVTLDVQDASFLIDVPLQTG